MISGHVDDRPRIDVRAAARLGALAPGATVNVPVETLDGERRGAVTVTAAEAGALLEARWDGAGKLPETRVELAYTACALGGQRPWWLCPGCHTRIALLYVRPDGHWRCRHCLGLVYRCQQEAHLGRLALRISRLRRRLGPNGTRPRGRRWRTYLRDVERLDAAEDAFRRALGETVEAHARRLETPVLQTASRRRKP